MAKQIPWGAGQAPLIAPSTKSATETVVLWGDLHAPYHDPAVVGAMLALIEAVQPDRIVNLGDTQDFHAISRWARGAERVAQIQVDIDAGNAVRRAVREAAPNSQLIEVLGNHDARQSRYIAENAPALSSLRALEPAELYLWRELEIKHFGEAGVRLRPGWLTYHGSAIRAGAGASAKAEALKTGLSGVSGHVHRLGNWKKTTYTGTQTWYEAGGMFRLDPPYAPGQPDWQRGLLIAEMSNKSDAYVVHEVPYVGNALYLGREKFTAVKAKRAR